MTPPPARSARPAPGGLLLFPGAGSSSDHPTLRALESSLAPLGALGSGLAPLPVARRDFPYRREGRKAPDRAPKLVASVVEEAAEVAAAWEVEPGALLLGGRSMGGRMCSMAVAEGLPAAGLVLLSYPLHPPGRPDRLRTEHFPHLDLPCLFLAGTKDPFGTPEEIEREVAAIPGPVTVRWLEGGRHDVKGRDDDIVALVSEWIREQGRSRPGSSGRRRRG